MHSEPTTNTHDNKRHTLKRVFALIGVVFLIILYVISFFLGISNNPNAFPMFLASLLATFFIPTTIFAYQLFYKVLKRDNTKNKFKTDNDSNEE